MTTTTTNAPPQPPPELRGLFEAINTDIQMSSMLEVLAETSSGSGNHQLTPTQQIFTREIQETHGSRATPHFAALDQRNARIREESARTREGMTTPGPNQEHHNNNNLHCCGLGQCIRSCCYHMWRSRLITPLRRPPILRRICESTTKLLLFTLPLVLFCLFLALYFNQDFKKDGSMSSTSSMSNSIKTKVKKISRIFFQYLNT